MRNGKKTCFSEPKLHILDFNLHLTRLDMIMYSGAMPRGHCDSHCLVVKADSLRGL